MLQIPGVSVWVGLRLPLRVGDMEILQLIGLGLLIMLARIADVTIGTLRVISVIDGRIKTSFILGFAEVVIWLSVISVTLTKIQSEPILALFFAIGFSLGNALGILVERRIPLGNLTLRAVGAEEILQLAGGIHDLGLNCTVLRGEGRGGQRNMLFCFMAKPNLKRVLPLLKPLQQEIFYTLDYGGTSNQVLLPRQHQSRRPDQSGKRR